jgi:indolepyruvate ferredoxin oxidoreductase alpha subunit
MVWEGFPRCPWRPKGASIAIAPGRISSSIAISITIRRSTLSSSSLSKIPHSTSKLRLTYIFASRRLAKRTVQTKSRRSLAKSGVISCGFVSTLVREEHHFALGYAHPLPERQLVNFLRDLDRVLIVEEIAPMVEESIAALVAKHSLKTKVFGRLTGHLPRIGALEEKHIAEAWERVGGAFDLNVSAAVSGGILELPCGGFELLYEVLDEVLPEGYLVAGDVGCSILHGYFPPQIIDTAYALGTAIATAAGMSLSGRKGVAIVGDTGFIHSGITGLLDAVEHGHDVLVIILYNKYSAMTPGAQPIPGLERVRALVEACGVDTIDEVQMESVTKDELRGLVQRRLAERGVQVLLAHARPRKLHE